MSDKRNLNPCQHALRATRRWSETPAFRPQTALGRRLWAIRQRIIASGVPLLTDEEIEAEVTAVPVQVVVER